MMKKTYVRQTLTGLTLAAAALSAANAASASVHPGKATAKHSWTAAYVGSAPGCDINLKSAPHRGLPNGTWRVDVTTARYAGNDTYDVTVRPQRHGKSAPCGYVDAGSTVHLKLPSSLQTNIVAFGATGPILVTAPGWAAANVMARGITGRSVSARGNSYVVPRKLASELDPSLLAKVTVHNQTITGFTGLYAP